MREVLPTAASPTRQTFAFRSLGPVAATALAPGRPLGPPAPLTDGASTTPYLTDCGTTAIGRPFDRRTGTVSPKGRGLKEKETEPRSRRGRGGSAAFLDGRRKS